MQQAGAEVIRPRTSFTTYRAKAAGNVNVEKTLDNLILGKEVKEKMQQVEVVEDY